MPCTPDEAHAVLAGHPDYRVLKRLDLSYGGGAASLAGTVRRAAIVDVETTGMDPMGDEVIELGVVVFEYVAETGEVGRVVARYSGLEDPGRPIPPEVTAVHGITDAMVAGQAFDEQAIAQVVEGVSLVIAHNAAFDRPFVENRFPAFATLPWACSIQDIPWKQHGVGSAALEFLAYRAGFFYDAHRAEMDCLAVLAVLARPFADTGTPALALLLASAREPSCLLSALNSPYETKDKLKRRGYRWAAEARVWVMEFKVADRAREMEWVKAEVYGGRSAEVELESVDARQRYSRRAGRKERVKV